MYAICINDKKCRKLLKLGHRYFVEKDEFRPHCFKVTLDNNSKKGVTAKNHVSFKKDRFVVVKK